jgi:hypothetical protein
MAVEAEEWPQHATNEWVAHTLPCIALYVCDPLPPEVKCADAVLEDDFLLAMDRRP